MGNDELVGWKEICSFLDISQPTAWRYENFGGLPVVRLFNGQVRGFRSEIRAWIIITDKKKREAGCVARRGRPRKFF